MTVEKKNVKVEKILKVAAEGVRLISVSEGRET
jgi:hypothetical protein